MIRRTLLRLSVLAIMLAPVGIVGSAPAGAADIFSGPCSQLPKSATVCQDTKSAGSTDPLITVIKAIMEIISFVTGVAAVILIIISAIKFVVAGGDSSAVAGARGTLVYALIGVLVTVLAQSIIAFVLSKIH